MVFIILLHNFEPQECNLHGVIFCLVWFGFSLFGSLMYPKSLE